MNQSVLFLSLLMLPGLALAQGSASQHGTMQHVPGMTHQHPGQSGDSGDDPSDDRDHRLLPPAGGGGLTEGGQSAFAAIQEVVARLVADPDTDWRRVDIEALRQHLIDMNNVTLRAGVEARPVEGGARFEATSTERSVRHSIRAMVPAHAATMDGVEGWSLQAEQIPGGAALTVTGADPERIRALGFIGVMTVGMHHQAHHFALASGQSQHAH